MNNFLPLALIAALLWFGMGGQLPSPTPDPDEPPPSPSPDVVTVGVFAELADRIKPGQFPATTDDLVLVLENLRAAGDVTEADYAKLDEAFEPNLPQAKRALTA